jgi:hypothetical protein
VIGNEYMAHNPGKLERFGTAPMHIGGSVVITPHGEYDLTAYLNSAIDNMLYSGKLTSIIAKHETAKGSFLLPALPYSLDDPAK